MKKYTILEAAEKLGIKHGRLREWISRGYIIPYEPTTGRGTKNLLNESNLYQIKSFEFLLQRGVSRNFAVKMMSFTTETHRGAGFIIDPKVFANSFNDVFKDGFDGKVSESVEGAVQD